MKNKRMASQERILNRNEQLQIKAGLARKNDPWLKYMEGWNSGRYMPVKT